MSVCTHMSVHRVHTVSATDKEDIGSPGTRVMAFMSFKMWLNSGPPQD